MTKIIAITGATGAQGGGVANILLKTPGWKVRAITRSTTSDKAKDLASRGAEVVTANYDDIESLKSAFSGVHAVFAVTNFWEHLFGGKSKDEAGAAEAAQAKKLAHAAAQTPTLEHFVFSSLPHAKKLTGIPVAHLDYKAEVDDYIREHLPELARNTTYLFFGYYASNIALFPLLRPFEVPGSYGKYVQIAPTNVNSRLPVAGDLAVTPGVWVRQILANPEKSKTRYAIVAPEMLSFGEMIDIWNKVTGRQGVFVQTSYEDFEKVWGVGGSELADQFKFGEVLEDWIEAYDSVGMEELGIEADAIPGFRSAIEALKGFL